MGAAQVEVSVEDELWGEPEALIARAVTAALRHLGHEPSLYEVSVLACDDARIRTLNREFRGRDKATNVLSWPAVDLSPENAGEKPFAPEPGSVGDPEPLGDIALARETCAREAAEQGKSLEDHLTHLVVHSVLHLLGHDHETEADAVLMETTETAILAGLGIADPYAGAASAPDADIAAGA